MFKKTWLWYVVGILLLLSFSGIWERWNAEINNQTYEIAVPLEGFIELTKNGNLDIDLAISELKEAGLTSVSIEPLSLLDMEERGIISIYTSRELEDILQLSGGTPGQLEDGYYFSFPDDEYIRQLIEKHIQPEIVHIGISPEPDGLPFYFVTVKSDIDLSEKIGYDLAMIERLMEQNLNVILRLENSSAKANERLVRTAIELKDYAGGILFSGEEIVGFPQEEQQQKWGKMLKQAGFHFYMIEFTNQSGFAALAKETDYHIVRLHSINLNEKTLTDNVNQAIRAVKERKIQSVYFHLQEKDLQTSLENARVFINNIHQEMPAHIQHAPPQAMEKVQTPFWQHILIFIAGILLTYLAVRGLAFHGAAVVATLLMTFIAGLYFFMEHIIWLQIFTLIIAAVTPALAVVTISRKTAMSFLQLTLRYLQAIGITFTGVVIIVGLLNGNAFLTGVEIFRGVKLVYVLPILFTGTVLFKDELLAIINNEGLQFFQREVKYWHVLVLLVIGAIGLIYIMRTGNTGFASELELSLRTLLEEAFYVRPRTKEFLIGFPFFILGLYLKDKHIILGKICLTIGVIGFLSIVNTFTHFHIPLYVSLLRTMISIVLGYGLGIVFIFLYQQGMRQLRRRFT